MLARTIFRVRLVFDLVRASTAPYNARMSEYLRWRIGGGTYFFTIVTYKRKPILCSDFAREKLREAIASVRKRRPFEIKAIVLLPDHLHTVWTLPQNDADYSTRIRQIKTLFTRSFDENGVSQNPSRKKRAEHEIWQRRFYEHTVRDDKDLKHCVDYIHINPVKHKLVKSVKNWKWSSFHRYVKLGEYDQDWCTDMKWFGDEFME